MIEALLPAILPALADGVRGLFNKISGGAGAKPANVGEVIQLMGAETERLQALAEIDKAGDVSRWVSNVRAMQRPVACGLIIGGYLVALVAGADAEAVDSLGGYAQMVTFYLFGDRTWSYIKRGR